MHTPSVMASSVAADFTAARWQGIDSSINSSGNKT
jgi:hypothetical protein